MGLTASSVGKKANDGTFFIERKNENDVLVALAGNPNVGKSSLFNRLTGLHQHTGNWPGKTVTNARGVHTHNGKNYIMTDIPGTYSLMAHSKEEEVARDFICFGEPDSVIVVCDATCLERNMNLVLQTLEITENVVVCVNLMDEARKHKIDINLKKLSKKLGIPVVGTVARNGKGINDLISAVDRSRKPKKSVYKPRYTKDIEDAINILVPVLSQKLLSLPARWVAIKLLEGDASLINSINENLGINLQRDKEISSALDKARAFLLEKGISEEKLCDMTVSCIVLSCEDICNGVIKKNNDTYRDFDLKIDRLLTGRLTGIPVMIMLLLLIFWITIEGANIPSRLISGFLLGLEDDLVALSVFLNIPEFIYSPIIFGVYHVLSWVVSVMLPPMAVFFPLFTLLEDLGYLPRVAFNLDHHFKKCNTCGKQALTMCMGFGCNAAGVVGTRIIDSKRERLIAILTNALVPCNGRFPALISIISMFFVCSVSGIMESVFGALLLTAFVVLGIMMTFLSSKFLSKTLLKGEPSSFTLEMPPYRRPDFGRIIVRSIFDRTLFVLSRAVSVAAPAGLVIWLFANITIGDATILSHASTFLDPIARIIGLDGTILLAFILGFPANEIVVPIIIMSYMSLGTISDNLTLMEMKSLFLDNGWTILTAINVLIFEIMHWPCSTTLLTVKKETGSLKWTLVAFLLPTILGIVCCFITTLIFRLF